MATSRWRGAEGNKTPNGYSLSCHRVVGIIAHLYIVIVLVSVCVPHLCPCNAVVVSLILIRFYRRGMSIMILIHFYRRGMSIMEHTSYGYATILQNHTWYTRSHAHLYVSLLCGVVCVEYIHPRYACMRLLSERTAAAAQRALRALALSSHGEVARLACSATTSRQAQPRMPPFANRSTSIITTNCT